MSKLEELLVDQAILKLGELVVDRRTWVRNKESLDHVRCLVNDLVNGATFPPLLVDKNTKIIVGGNHRYHAYRQFYGEGWENKEVDVLLLDMPPFEQDPQTWYLVALEDNQHLVERLGYGDRNNVVINIMKAQDDPRAWIDSPEADLIRRLTHKTPQGWIEFTQLVLESMEKAHMAARHYVDEPPAEKSVPASKLAAEETPKQSIRPIKYSTDDIQPVDTKNLTNTYNSQVLSRAWALIELLENKDPRYLSDKSREALERLARAIEGVLSVRAA